MSFEFLAVFFLFLLCICVFLYSVCPSVSSLFTLYMDHVVWNKRFDLIKLNTYKRRCCSRPVLDASHATQLYQALRSVCTNHVNTKKTCNVYNDVCTVKRLFICARWCVVIQILMNVLWITEAVVRTPAASTHLEAASVPAMQDIVATDSPVQVTLHHKIALQ